MHISKMKHIYSLKTRIVVAIICTVALYALLVVGSITPVEADRAQEMVEEFRDLVSGINSALDIFLNNFVISLLMVIPALGIIIGGWIVYNTGLIVSSFATMEGISVVLFLVIPIITIYGLLEFIGYGIMMSEGIMLIYAIRKKSIKSELKILPIIITISAGFLGLAALIEFSLLTIVQTISI